MEVVFWYYSFVFFFCSPRVSYYVSLSPRKNFILQITKTAKSSLTSLQQAQARIMHIEEIVKKFAKLKTVLQK